MKNKIIFLLCFLPVFVFGQTDLVKWDNINFTPTIVASNVTASNMTASSGVQLNSQEWGGHVIVNNQWPNANTYNNGTYVQFSITAASGYQINLSSFVFRYRRDDDPATHANSIRVRYSKTADFSSGVEQFTDISSIPLSTQQTATLSFPANTIVNQGETMYIRFHIWGGTNQGWSQLSLRNPTYPSWDQHQGPTIRGTVSQVVASADLVRWNNTNFAPTVVANNITSGNITVAGGVSLSHQNWGNEADFFQMGSWPTPSQNSGGIDTNKYVEFIVSPQTGYQINLDQFRFNYRSQGTPQNYQVRYSKNNFTSYYTMTGNTSGSTSWTNVSGSLSSVNPVMPGETVRIRVYAYNTNNNLHIKRLLNTGTPTNYSQTPTITGTVSTAAPPLPVANNDAVSTCRNTPITINILANNGNGADTYATLSAITITQQPANGQNITVNGLTNVTYTPNNNFSGSDTFKYTITDQNGTSNEATVSVNVMVPTVNNDSSSTYKNTPVNVNILSNDTNTAGITTISVSSPSVNGGTVVANGVTNITYTPANNFVGTDTFTYTITTSCGTSSSATVTIQVNEPPLAEWALTSNGNVTYQQSYVNATNITLGEYNSCYDSNGAKIWGHNNGNIVHGRYFDIRISPTSGNTISVSNLLFEHESATGGPSNYSVRYYVGNSVPNNFDFLGSASVLIPEESINGNQVKNVSLGPVIVGSGQTLVVRFYAKGTNWGDCNNNYWLIKQNTLKLLGKKLDPLAGTYIIGNGAGAHYSTLTAAVNALNVVGVNAPVTFLLDKDTFENTTNFSNGEIFPLTINSFTGSSAFNTVTFKPAPGRHLVTVRVNNLMVGSNALRPTYLFKLNGADNIIFDGSNNNSESKNLRLRNNSDYNNNRTVLWLTEGANNNIFSNMFIEQVETSSWAYAAAIFAGANNSEIGTESNNPASDITVSNNLFLGVKQGVYLANSGSNFSTNYNIYYNEFGDPNQQNSLVNSVYLKGIQGFNVYNNNIYDVYVTWSGSGYHSGIYVLGNSINGKIYKNRMRSIFGNATNTLTSGIRLASTNAANDVGISVTNNFIANIRSAGGGGFTQGAYSIYAETGRGYKIWHNSVNTTINNPVGLSAGLMVDQARNLDIRNNIFINRVQEALSYKFAIGVNGAPNFNEVFSNLDYNNYRVYEAQSQSFTAGYNNLTNQSVSNPGFLKTLGNWQAVTPATMDVHSGSDMTTFISTTNLHISDNTSWVNNTGIGLSAEFLALGYSAYDDIDDQPRSITTPDIGADEFGIPVPEPGICEVTLYWNGSQWLDGDNNPVAPTTNFKTQLNAPYNTQIHGSFRTCELTVATGGSLRINGGDYVYIVHRLINNLTASAVVVENNGSIVQETDFNDNQGNITYKRTSNPMYNYDYTYWSSPVAGQTTQNLSSGSGNYRYRFNPTVVYSGGYFYQAGWTGHNGIMQPGQGYIIKAPNSFPNNPASTPLNYTASFIGVPNSGPLSVTVDFGNTYSPSQLPTANEENPATGYPDGDYGWYYFGNPYPSAIDIARFRNFSGNDDILGTSVYLWAHNTQPVLPEDGDLYQYVSNDFAVFNTSFMDGTQASPFNPNDPVTGGATSQNPNYNAAGRYIAAGQGFFMAAKSGTIFFNNSMRVNPFYSIGNMPNNHFYRTSAEMDSSIIPPSTNSTGDSSDPNTHKMKLSIQNEQGAFHQMMLGYIDGATDELDNTDAVVFGGASYVTLYSIAEEAALVIQGRALPFTTDDEVPLGIRLGGISGTFTINLDHTDGIFKDEYGNQDIYIEDTYLNVIHNLKSAPYEFTSEEGIYNNRFILRYMNPLNVNDIDLNNNWGVYSKDGQLEVFSKGFEMQKIAVYDMLGRLVYEKDSIDSANHTITKINGNQILIVKVTSTDNKSSVKKVKN